MLRIVMKSGAQVDVDATWSAGTDPIVPGSRLRAKATHIDPTPDAARRLLHLDWDEVAAIVEISE